MDAHLPEYHLSGTFCLALTQLLFQLFQLSIDRHRLELLKVDDAAKLEQHHLVTLLLHLADTLLKEFAIFYELDVFLLCLSGKWEIKEESVL